MTFLQDKQTLRSAQRLVAFAILHQAYSSQQASSNPFIVFLVNVSEVWYIVMFDFQQQHKFFFLLPSIVLNVGICMYMDYIL